jgi:FtsP/CotA-like multicopper oxidase with cupredoxin domain
VVDLPVGGPLVLQSFGGGGGRGGGNGGQAATLLTINGPIAPPKSGLPPLPERLNTIPRLDPSAAAVTRPMVLAGGRGGRTINGQSMRTDASMQDMSSVFRVKLGDLERWNIVNQSGETHVFHVHDVEFQILSRNGVAPGPTEAGRKDTVMVRPRETVPILMRFEDYTDGMPYMYHCHILPHEDQGMMGQFVVEQA